MKKNLIKTISVMLVLMLAFSSTAFAAYTVDELSGVNAAVKLRDGMDKDPQVGVNIVENVKPYVISSSTSNSAMYDAATDTYTGISMATYTNLLTFRKQDGLKYDLGSKYLVSFDILVDSVNTTNNVIFSFMRAKGDGTGRSGDDAEKKFLIPVDATPGKYRHVEFVYDLTNATERGEGKDDFCLWISQYGVDNGKLNIANFRIEKYFPSTPAANLLGRQYKPSCYHILTEFAANTVNGWDDIVGWKDGEGVTMQSGRKYRFTAQLEIPEPLNAQKTIRLTRATANSPTWTSRSNSTAKTHTIPSGTSGNYFIDIVLDYTAVSDITNNGTYTGLLLVAESNLGQKTVLTAAKLYDITEEFAVYQNVEENILYDAPTTVYNKKYTGEGLPKSITVENTAGDDGGYNIFAWKYSDTFKLTVGKKYRMSFDWSVPSTTDTDTKTIAFSLSDATCSTDCTTWTGRGDYLVNSVYAFIKPDVLSGTISTEFVYNPSDINSGITFWRSNTSSSAPEYTVSNFKIVPVLEEIDIQKDGNEIVVIQNEKSANAFDDVIILAEYAGDTLKSFDFTTPATIAEKNAEGTIALRAKLNVSDGSTVKMFRWDNFSDIKPVSVAKDVK